MTFIDRIIPFDAGWVIPYMSMYIMLIIPPALSITTQQIRRYLIGMAIMFAVALPWTAYIMTRVPGLVRLWFDEVRLEREARFEHRIGGWFAYFMIVPLMLPWAVWFVSGSRGGRRSWAWATAARCATTILLSIRCFLPERSPPYANPHVDSPPLPRPHAKPY